MENTTSADNSMRYCSKEGIMCSCANDHGYCNLTVCINHDLKNKDQNSYKHEMCSNCRYRWNDTCDKGMNPLTCDSWDPE